MKCIFCQNYDISQTGYGDEVSHVRLAEIMLKLQEQGCHNINFVSPSHMIYPILKSLTHAIPRGLNIPLVYNSGGYDSVSTIELLEGVFDIYMPDLKYMDADIAHKLSGAADYPSVAASAIKEMYRQVGDLYIDPLGIAVSGLLVRHLVLPADYSNSQKAFELLASISNNIYINIMDQYRPEYKSNECEDIERKITVAEFNQAVAYAKQAGLSRFSHEKNK